MKQPHVHLMIADRARRCRRAHVSNYSVFDGGECVLWTVTARGERSSRDRWPRVPSRRRSADGDPGPLMGSYRTPDLISLQSPDAPARRAT